MRTLSISVLFVALCLSVTPAIAADEHTQRLNGVWNVSVAVRNRETGEIIWKVRALNLYVHDGSMTETSSNVMRGPSVGTWRHVEDNRTPRCPNSSASTRTRTFASTARVIRTIELSQDRTRFTSTGTVEDFNAQNVKVSIGCSTETAARAQ